MILNKKRKKNNIASGYWLLLVLFICAALMLGSAVYGIQGGPLYSAASVIFTPMQKGINKIGQVLVDLTEEHKTKEELIAENEALKNQVDELNNELNTMVLDVYELDNLRDLYQIDNQYADYEKVGANVIGMNAGNWFSTFTIDKGSEDGITVDMNVLSGSGLVGIVTETSAHSATVRSIIDDDSNVSAMILSSQNRMIVSGSLSQMNESQEILFSGLRDDDNSTEEGAQVVTSYISDKYLPGIVIGYVSDVTLDANNLTKSGKILPAADFNHLSEVLVILNLKSDEE